MTDQPDDAYLDGCNDDGILGDEPPLVDDETDLFVLFAEALDPDNPKTVAEAEAEWREILQ